MGAVGGNFTQFPDFVLSITNLFLELASQYFFLHNIGIFFLQRILEYQLHTFSYHQNYLKIIFRIVRSLTKLFTIEFKYI